MIDLPLRHSVLIEVLLASGGSASKSSSEVRGTDSIAIVSSSLWVNVARTLSNPAGGFGHTPARTHPGGIVSNGMQSRSRMILVCVNPAGARRAQS